RARPEPREDGSPGIRRSRRAAPAGREEVMIEPTDVAIDTLLAELRDRLDDSVDAPTPLRGLLEAVLVVGSGLELDSMLQRIVSAATALLDARYGALGVRA